MERSVFLASTADDRPARTEDLVACGFQGVLVKPLDIDTLANELKPYLAPKAAPPAGEAGAPELVPSRHPITLEGQLQPDHGASRSQRGCGRRSAGSPGRGSDNADRGRDRLDPGPGRWLTARSQIARDRSGMDPASLKTAEPTRLNAETVRPSALLPEDSTVALVVPVAKDGEVYGLVILSERRRGRFLFPPPRWRRASPRRRGSVDPGGSGSAGRGHGSEA